MLPGKKLSLPDILRMARRRVWLLVLPPVVTLFGALIYSSTVPNLYESDMLIAIDPQRVPDSYVRSTVTMETERRLDALQVQVLSRTTLLQIVEELGLYKEERATLPMEDVVRKMREAITVVAENTRPRAGQPQTTAFHVRFTYPDPKIAADVTERLGYMFVQQNVKDRGALAGATNKFLETQLAEARAKLDAQDQAMEAFRQRHGQELPTQTQSNMQALSSAQLRAQGIVESVARDRDRKQMLERLHRDAAAEPAPVTPTPAAVPGSTIAVGSAEQQLATARAALAGLELKYKPDHPDVARARRQVVELEVKAEQERQVAATRDPGTAAPVASLSPAEQARRQRLREQLAEIESLDRQIAFKEADEQRVRAEIAEYQRRLEAVPGLESEWVKLTRDNDTQQTAYRDLLTKSTAAQMAANLEDQDIGERFRIVDPAQVPVHPLPSLRVRYNALGLVLGLVLGLGIAAMLELRDQSFRSEADVVEVLSLPVLTTVPYVETAADTQKAQRRRLAMSVASVVCVVAAGYVAWTLKLWKSLI